MRLFSPFGVSLLTLVGLSGASARSEVVHGFQDIMPTYLCSYNYSIDQGFDFLTRSIVYWSSAEADLSFSCDAMCEGSAIYSKNCSGAIVDKPLDEISEAPSDLFPFSVNTQLNRSYVVRTGDNIYTKFAVRAADCYGIQIEYYVQTDGSSNFGPLLPVRPTTWGQVKALYR